MSRNRFKLWLIATSLIFVAAAPACSLGPDNELCEAEAECGEIDKDSCYRAEQQERDAASAYGCEVLYAEYVDCAVETGTCNEGYLELSEECWELNEKYNECINNAFQV